MEGREGRRRGEGKWYPHFWEKVTPVDSCGGVCAVYRRSWQTPTTLVRRRPTWLPLLLSIRLRALMLYATLVGSCVKVGREGRKGMRRGEGKWYPDFLGESYARGQLWSSCVQWRSAACVVWPT